MRLRKEVKEVIFYTGLVLVLIGAVMVLTHEDKELVEQCIEAGFSESHCMSIR